MNKLKKVLITTVLTFTLIFNICISNVLADVGDFETYDSGYSSSSSSNWSSSSGDSNYDYENNDSTGDLATDIIVGIATVIGIVVISIFIGISENIKNKNKKNNTTNRVTAKKLTEDDIVAKIKMQDENFNKEEFISWAKDLFIKLQYAWSDRDWSTIKCFETQELFEQHSKQLQQYIDTKRINIVDIFFFTSQLESMLYIIKALPIIPTIGITGPNGSLNVRGAFGSLFLKIRTSK